MTERRMKMSDKDNRKDRGQERKRGKMEKIEKFK